MSPCSVLILYNLPGTLAAQQQGHAAEADLGVLDEVAAVSAALTELGHPHRAKGVRSLRDVQRVVMTASEPCVFNLVESLAGPVEDFAAVPAICRAAGKRTTGNGERPQLLGLDKQVAKAVLQSAGVAVPAGCCLFPGDPIPVWPERVMVKPLQSDAGEGIDDGSVLPGNDSAAIATRVAALYATFEQPAVVEAFVDGRELNVSLVDGPAGPRVLPIAEIEFIDFAPGQPLIVGYAAKWDTGSHAYHHTLRRIPADLPDDVAARVGETARRAWSAMGCEGYARVDLRLDAAGVPHVLEVNPNPDISPEAGFAAALKAGGIRYTEFIAALVNGFAGTGDAGSRAADPLSARAAARRAEAAYPERFGPPATLSIERVSSDHRAAVLALVAATRFFHDFEITIAAEVLDAALHDGPGGDYQSFVALRSGTAVGWVCYGRTACTASTWDVYWLAVDPAAQGSGVGRELMRFAETRIAAAGGTLAVIETASRPEYAPTRAFYERIGYVQVADIPDFYAPGDSKIVLTRAL